MPEIVTSTDNYLSFLLTFKNFESLTTLAIFFLAMGRIIPIMYLAPFFGGKNVPGPVRIMFGVSLIAIIFPQLLLSIKTEIPFDLAFAGYMLKELVIGFILAFFVTIPFYIAQTSGSLIDHIRGAQSLQVADPTTSSKTGPVGVLYNYVLITIFYFIGGPFYFIDALTTSFEIIPVNDFISPHFFNLDLPFWQTMTDLINQTLKLSIQLGAPSIIGILMAEMFLGIANRLAPQVQIVFLGISLKSWVGLALLTVSWYFIMTQMGKESINWLKMIQSVIDQLKFSP
ncbi:MAG TPA: EscT/YscT/HrcT family type III secretion system export apparatus protein [Chlamydiales bacterium]|nr:EscT/YscT/HrcT family type III secretion system export apparatus protein [Chlamydiales bacterium]